LLFNPPALVTKEKKPMPVIPNQRDDRRPLGAPILVGGYLVRVFNLLVCPVCYRPLRAHDAREIEHGVTLTCSGCHIDEVELKLL
jgi:hypothetical protein